MNRTLLTLGLATIACSSFAYNAQLDGNFTYTDHDDNFTDTDHQFELKGTFYFNPVSIKNTPLNEAAFLGHNSNAYLGYSYNYLESKTILATKSEADLYTIYGGIEYFVEQFYLNGELGFGQSEIKVISPLGNITNESDVTNYRALVGYMPVSNLLLAAGIDGYQGDGDLEDNRFAVRAKYVAPMDQGQFLNVEADGAFGDRDSLTLGADYYFDQAFSLGAAYNIEDNGEDDVDFFSIRSKYFINSNFAIGGAVGFGDDVQAFNINATYRF